MYVPSRKAIDLLGLHPNTLRRYADSGKIEYIRNEAGQRLYNVQSYRQSRSSESTTICYCRVSSRKQKDDLARQIVLQAKLRILVEQRKYDLEINGLIEI